MTSSMKTILIADDEEDLRLLVQVTLESPSYRLLLAVDGHEAWKAIKVHRPDLIILDWMMPGLNGVEVLAKLTECSDTASIPVIMLTAKDDEEMRGQITCFPLAAYLVKPFSPLELIQKVREVLSP